MSVPPSPAAAMACAAAQWQRARGSDIGGGYADPNRSVWLQFARGRVPHIDAPWLARTARTARTAASGIPQPLERHA
eukprot:6056419-Pleurochrysis_carterae.AAC.7